MFYQLFQEKTLATSLRSRYPTFPPTLHRSSPTPPVPPPPPPLAAGSRNGCVQWREWARLGRSHGSPWFFSKSLFEVVEICWNMWKGLKGYVEKCWKGPWFFLADSLRSCDLFCRILVLKEQSRGCSNAFVADSESITCAFLESFQQTGVCGMPPNCYVNLIGQNHDNLYQPRNWTSYQLTRRHSLALSPPLSPVCASSRRRQESQIDHGRSRCLRFNTSAKMVSEEQTRFKICFDGSTWICTSSNFDKYLKKINIINLHSCRQDSPALKGLQPTAGQRSLSVRIPVTG